MSVASTPSNHKAFTWNGLDTRQYSLPLFLDRPSSLLVEREDDVLLADKPLGPGREERKSIASRAFLTFDGESENPDPSAIAPADHVLAALSAHAQLITRHRVKSDRETIRQFDRPSTL